MRGQRKYGKIIPNGKRGEGMKFSLRYQEDNPGRLVYSTLLLFAISLLVVAFAMGSPASIAQGMVQIFLQSDALITDYIGVASAGAAFFNAGIVMLCSILLLKALKVPFMGMSVACCFLMGGFSLFGKNLLNVLPILLGTQIYAWYQHTSLARYVYIGLFGTSLSPIVTEMALMTRDWHFWPSILFSTLVGVFIGFVLPPIAAYTIRLHQGYNLYNVGFAAGLVGLVLVSLLRSFGNDFDTRLVWGEGHNAEMALFLGLLFTSMIALGWWYNGRSFRGFWHLTRHSGRSIADFILMDGYPVTLINMGVVGLFAAGYVLLVGGQLNGPTIGGIFTIVGFGAFGKHLKNIVWVMLGVVISSWCMVWDLTDPAVMLAALFSTGLAPIAGHFGPLWGTVAGIIHASVVLNVGVLYSGLNLYNNGFAAGLVCIVLLPLIQALRREKEDE